MPNKPKSSDLLQMLQEGLQNLFSQQQQQPQTWQPQAPAPSIVQQLPAAPEAVQQWGQGLADLYPGPQGASPLQDMFDPSKSAIFANILKMMEKVKSLKK